MIHAGVPGRCSCQGYVDGIPAAGQAAGAGAVPAAACGGRCGRRTSGRVPEPRVRSSPSPTHRQNVSSRGRGQGTTGGRGGWLLAGLKPSPIGEERITGTRKTAGRRGRAAGARWEPTAAPIGRSPPEAGRLEDSAHPEHTELRLVKSSPWIAPTAREP